MASCMYAPIHTSSNVVYVILTIVLKCYIIAAYMIRNHTTQSLWSYNAMLARQPRINLHHTCKAVLTIVVDDCYANFTTADATNRRHFSDGERELFLWFVANIIIDNWHGKAADLQGLNCGCKFLYNGCAVEINIG